MFEHHMKPIYCGTFCSCLQEIFLVQQGLDTGKFCPNDIQELSDDFSGFGTKKQDKPKQA